MSDLSDQPPRLDDALREIDRRLRMIRLGLDPARPAGALASAPEREDAGRRAPRAAHEQPRPARERASGAQRAAAAHRSPRAGPLAEALERLRELASGQLSAESCGRAAPSAATSPGGPVESLLALQSVLGELQERLAQAQCDCRRALAAALADDGRPAAGAERAPEGPTPALHDRPAAADVGVASVVAGPFADPGAVREFLRLVGELEAVQEARLVGYEGDDRAVLEVRLREDRRSAAPPGGGEARDRGGPYPWEP